MQPMPPVERFTGSVVGQCLGDALGFVVEGYPPETCAEYVNTFLRSDRTGETGRGRFAFGQYTDDSQLAREMLESFVECRRFDPASYARRVAAIFAENRIVGRGRATAAAAQRLAQGVPWQESGTPPPQAGNGSAMRAGPIGLFFFDDPERMVAAAHDQGRITHADPRSSAGAAAIAGAVALALQGRLKGTDAVVAQLVEWSAPLDLSFAKELGRLPGWLDLVPEAAGPEIARAGLQPGFSDRWQGISPFVTSSVLWSLYSVLHSPDDYWETICTAIAVGGDVDTTAAMAGAISGAALGLRAIPHGLAVRLTDQETWGYNDLVGLAERCHEIKAGQL